MHHKVVCDYQSGVDSVLAKYLRVQFLFAKQVSILQLFSFAIMNNIRQIPTWMAFCEQNSITKTGGSRICP